jgi:predicted DsbA family dithiol-disulfide isomerase
MHESERPETIELYSDYVCPFCYLGRQSLAQYQETREARLEIDWQPFDLRSRKRNPDGSIDHSVDDGKDEDYYERAKQNVRQLAEQYDVEMALDLSREVDSLNAQIASWYVKEHYPYETWLAFDEAILAALWEEGRDIGDPEVLADLADDAGVDSDVRSAVDDETLVSDLRAQFQAAQEFGITGVPTFVYGEHGARGAVPPEQLRRLVEGTDGR